MRIDINCCVCSFPCVCQARAPGYLILRAEDYLGLEFVPKAHYEKGDAYYKVISNRDRMSFLVGKVHLLGSVFSKIQGLFREDLAILLYVTVGFLFHCCIVLHRMLLSQCIDLDVDGYLNCFKFSTV